MDIIDILMAVSVIVLGGMYLIFTITVFNLSNGCSGDCEQGRHPCNCKDNK